MKKTIKVIGYGLWVMVALLVSAPLTAQNAQENQWKTPTMQGSGSAYSSNVTAVGATSAASAATTTESYSPVKSSNGPHRVIEYNQEQDDNDEGSPIGDAVLPLMAFAMLFGGVIYLRRKRAAKS